MSAFYAGAFLGALVITFLLSRAFHRWVFRSQPHPKKAIFSNLSTLVLAVALGSFRWDLAWAVTLYLPAAGLWLLVDLWRGRS